MATKLKDNRTEMAAAPANPDENVYRPRKNEVGFNTVPATIYFYYVAKVGNDWTVKHYFYVHGSDSISDATPGSGLEEQVKKLALNARAGGNNPPQIGEDWKYIVWNHKSYFVILIDDPSAQFDPGNAIVFDGTTPNHSFFDGRNFGVQLFFPGGDQTVPAFCCINHMKRNQAGADLGDYPEYFHFTLNTNKVLRSVTLQDFSDSGGTNMGPPTPPPGFVDSMATLPNDGT